MSEYHVIVKCGPKKMQQFAIQGNDVNLPSGTVAWCRAGDLEWWYPRDWPDPEKSKEARKSKEVLERQEAKERQLIADVKEVTDHYKSYHPRSKPGDKDRRRIRDRLTEKYTVADLLAAIDGCHRSPYHCGENPDNRKYQLMDLIFRDSAHVQMFLEIKKPEKPTKRSDPRKEFQVAIYKLMQKVPDSRNWEAARVKAAFEKVDIWQPAWEAYLE